ncbi:MAG: G5 domain-containing protein [Anaerolineae bacterium]
MQRYLRSILTLVSALTLGLGLLLLAVACTPPPRAASPNTVTLIADGEQRRLTTDAQTVGAVLNEAGIVLSGLDRVTPPEVTAVFDGLTITVVRVTEETRVLTQTIPFERQVVRDANVPAGESRLLQSGRSGVLERRYRLVIEEGEETERALVREAIVQEPREEVRLIGTKPQLQNVPITGTLAYLSKQDAWLMRESSFQARRLTHLGDLDGRVFALSPDGQRLLFSRTTTETDHLNELWLVPTTVASAKPVPLNLRDILWADWSPDGDSLAWTTAEVTEQAPGWRGQNDLWLAWLTDQQVLVSRRAVVEAEAGGGYGWWGTRYAWSPEGDLLAYSRPDGIGIVDLDDEVTVELLSFPPFRTYSSWAWNPDLSWSPDGEFVAGVVHVSDESEKPEESPIFNLMAVDRTGSYSATLAVEAGMWAAPSYAPDGERVLFGRAVIPYQSATSAYTVHAIDRDGSDQTLIYAPAGVPGLEVPEWLWSPDGRAIAFLQFGDVYLLALDADEPEVLTQDGSVTVVQWR